MGEVAAVSEDPSFDRSTEAGGSVGACLSAAGILCDVWDCLKADG